jgi:cytochrome c-type biogenesis protein CcmF
MDDIQYIGEHLLPRALGEIVTVISFSAILFAAIAFYMAMKREDNSALLQTARRLFTIHALSVFSLIGLMFYVMFMRYYEYAYAYEHVSDDLPFIYMFSAFWEGQQGSFLLWMFWHIILGFVLIRKAKEWEPGVLLALTTMQTWLASMMLGIFIPFTNIKLGDNPMLLLREVLDIPLFANEDYLELFTGKGLNLLLQNYWNVIHPPITFLGFASVTIPFAFVVAGLMTKKYSEWMKPALPWVLFSVGVLGVGILMGSAWAYEALTFGGYWAWDPVENMSLVPWIMLLAGLHAHLITQATGHSRRSVYLFYILAFCLSIYSTYLVRSGALQDTSVHAFTEMGLGPQLTAFLGFFVLGGAYMLIRHWKKIPTPVKEESGYSREFFMFIGLMILAISAILITYSTSLPVINNIIRLFKPEYEGQVIQDANAHYNKYQIWIAVFIGFLTGIAQWLRYRDDALPKKKVALHIASHLLLTLAATLGIASVLQDKSWPIISLLAAGLYGLIANLDYLINRIRSNWKLAGSVFSHMGFGIMVLGIILSGINKRHISSNPSLMAGLLNSEDEEMLMTNVVLMKNQPIYSQGFMLEYVQDSFIGQERQYFISFKELDKNGNPVDSFVVNPNVVYTKEFDNIAVYHPSIRHTLSKDYFTRISTLPRAEVDPKFAQAVEDTLVYTPYLVGIGDSIVLENHVISIEEVIQNPPTESLPIKALDKVMGVKIIVKNKNSLQSYTLISKAILRGNLSYVLPEKINNEELRIKVTDSLLLPYLPTQEFNADDILEFKLGESKSWNGRTFYFESFDKKAGHPFYKAQENDIAIGATLSISSDQMETTPLQPVYIIRDTEVQHVDDYHAQTGLLTRFLSIDPNTETVRIAVKELNPKFNLYVAENVPRTDFLVLEALAFPGINLFWFGACLMLGGVFFSWANRRKTAKR